MNYEVNSKSVQETPKFVSIAEEMANAITQFDFNDQVEMIAIIRRKVLDFRNGVCKDAHADIEATQVKIQTISQGSNVIIGEVK